MMQVGQDKSGMITINQSLVQLLLKRKISLETAFETSASADQLEKMMKHAGL
jgi:twitching motility protein PilT